MAKRHTFYLLALGYLLMMGGPALAVDPGLADYEKCLQELDATVAHYQSILPSSLLYEDRKLAYMIQGARVMRENVEIIRYNSAANPLAKYQPQMIGNAVVSCQDYKTQFESRAKKMLLFLFFAAGSVVFAFFHIVFTRLPGRRNAMVTVAASASAPSDQPVSAKKER